MLEDILIPFATIALAELGDKTQISVVLLSSQTSKHYHVLLGVMLAFLAVDGIAIAAGSWITTIISTEILTIISAAVFILFGLLLLFRTATEEQTRKFDKTPLIASFLLIFLTEWGDKTQIAAALFATQFNAILVLIGTIAALGLLSIAAVYFGSFLAARINKQLLNNAAGILFIIIGIIILII